MSNRNRNDAPMERIQQSAKSSNPAGYTLKPSIRNLILFTLAWALLTNLIYILDADHWLIFEWVFRDPTVRTIWGCCSVIIPVGAMYFVKILEDNDE